MARVVVVGGSGHVGTFLVPRLVEAGYEAFAVSRGKAAPYVPHKAWDRVEQVAIDRHAEEKAGKFGDRIADLKPDVVIDLICFTLESQKQIEKALRGRVQHFVHIGTIWVQGFLTEVPSNEAAPKNAFGDYGTKKAEIETWLLRRAHRHGFPASVVRPGHIVGPGWPPLNPAGHFNPNVFSDISAGRELVLPNFGLESVHHVHADDVAQVIMGCLENHGASVGEAFNAVSPAAVTMRGYASAMFEWFGHEPKLAFKPFDEWKKDQDPAEAQATWEHIVRSPVHAIDKARRLLGYAPRYTSLQAVQESVTWLIEQGKVTA